MDITEYYDAPNMYARIIELQKKSFGFKPRDYIIIHQIPIWAKPSLSLLSQCPKPFD